MHRQLHPPWLDRPSSQRRRGYLFSSDVTSEAFEAEALAHAKYGTTSLLATVISGPLDSMSEALALVAKMISRSAGSIGAEILGSHIEGPFLNEKKRGGHAAEFLKKPSLREADLLLSAGAGTVKLMTLAPELEGGVDLVAHLFDAGVIAAVGHSSATYDHVVAAIRHGLSGATHIFNAMDGLGSREPGTVGAVLSLRAITTSLIGDGVHVHPASMKAALRAKGLDGVFLVTDAVSPVGTNRTSYRLYGNDVIVRDGGCYTPEGVLAGSATPLNIMVRNMCSLLGLSIEEAVQLATVNPARFIGIFDRKGSLAAGKDADIFVAGPDFLPRHVLVGGRRLPDLEPID